MMNKDELKDVARFSHFKPYQQEKHYIQTIVLNSIYSTINDELVFKGGTCLLFFYGLNRFSEDLDFTMIKELDINKVALNIKKDLDNLGISSKISSISQDDKSITFKIGAEGPLFNKEIERCFVSVDISKRENVENFLFLEHKSIYREILGFNVSVMAEKEILAEKIRALLTRNQARDLFDIYFLLKKSVKPEINLINKKLEYYKKKFVLREFKEAVKDKKEIWDSELNALIIGNLPNFKEVSDFVIKTF